MHHLRYEEKWQQQVEYLVPHLIVSYSKFNLIIYYLSGIVQLFENIWNLGSWV